MKSRTKARSVALQVLYEIDMTGHLPGEVLDFRLEEDQLDDGQTEFTRQIVFGVAPLFIKPDWPLDQVAIIDRNIIRIALWEFAVSSMTPVKVAINEAIELAKSYGSDSTPRFVNGVLGSLANRQVEIQQSFGSKVNNDLPSKDE
jgi:N utilization substance protein B